MNLIRIRKLNKHYGHLHVLRDFDLDIYQKEKLVIIGSSGSGKSTLLRLLMSLEKYDSGVIEVDGERFWEIKRGTEWVTANEAHMRNIRSKFGMVFQHFNLFPHMKVLRNITEAPFHVLKKEREKAEKEAKEILGMVGLGDKVNAYPEQLSGGQKQRVAIARALAMHPKIMLFDEITSALDPELVGEVLNVLRQIATQMDMTMVIVTHEVGFAQDIADRVVFMDEGKVVEENPPEIIFKKPQQKRTREFLRAVLEAR